MFGKIFNVTLLGSALLCISISTCDCVRVDVDKGTLRGTNATTWKGRQFFAFKGIPYAKPPVGELRFKAPVEELPWSGVRDAASHGSICPQEILGTVRGDEDCLFLNVYTPSLRKQRRPVMVWIHGGGYVLGSGDDSEYGPDYFLDAEIVLVTINFRLGALGFLSTEDDGAPGNAALKDQVAALRWVKRNIAKFGGDPNEVTIFGESSGGVAVHYHLLSPMSLGLFTKAISQSGCALSSFTLSETPVDRTVRLAEALRGENLSGDKAKALEILKSASYEDIVKNQGRSLLTDSEKRLTTSVLFVPSVEKNVESEEVFLSDTPTNLLERGCFKKVPYMTGYNDKEGYLVFLDPSTPTGEFEALNDTERFVPIEMKNETLRNDIARSIRSFYFQDKPIGNENISNLVDLYTDIYFAAGIRRATELQLRSSPSPVYLYEFSYDGGFNYLKRLFDMHRPGAAHGDELGYLFDPKLQSWSRPVNGSEDEHVINTMIRLWTNFAKYGNPTPAGDPLTWKPATLDNFNFLNISGRDTKLRVNPDPRRAEFWADVYERDAASRHGRQLVL